MLKTRRLGSPAAGRDGRQPRARGNRGQRDGTNQYRACLLYGYAWRTADALLLYCARLLAVFITGFANIDRVQLQPADNVYAFRFMLLVALFWHPSNVASKNNISRYCLAASDVPLFFILCRVFVG